MSPTRRSSSSFKPYKITKVRHVDSRSLSRKKSPEKLDGSPAMHLSPPISGRSESPDIPLSMLRKTQRTSPRPPTPEPLSPPVAEDVAPSPPLYNVLEQPHPASSAPAPIQATVPLPPSPTTTVADQNSTSPPTNTTETSVENLVIHYLHRSPNASLDQLNAYLHAKLNQTIDFESYEQARTLLRPISGTIGSSILWLLRHGNVSPNINNTLIKRYVRNDLSPTRGYEVSDDEIEKIRQEILPFFDFFEMVAQDEEGDEESGIGVNDDDGQDRAYGIGNGSTDTKTKSRQKRRGRPPGRKVRFDPNADTAGVAAERKLKLEEHDVRVRDFAAPSAAVEEEMPMLGTGMLGKK